MMAIRHIIVVLFFIEQDLLEMKIKHKLVGFQAKLLELLRYLCILVIIDKNYRQMIDILHSTACVIALYKIIEAALSITKIWQSNLPNFTSLLLHHITHLELVVVNTIFNKSYFATKLREQICFIWYLI